MMQKELLCVYKATTKKGETAHFGEYSAAKAWAGWGSVEAVPLKTLTLIDKLPKLCGTCEALARTVMLDQTSHDTQRTWVGLTEDDRVLIKHDANFNQFMTAGEYADRVQQLTEARLKDKNT